MNIGLYSYYKIHNKNRMINNAFVPEGAGDTNYPYLLLAKILKDLGHSISTIDTGKIEDYDRVIFIEYPHGNIIGLTNRYLGKFLKKGNKYLYLVAMEPEAVKPDNWKRINHSCFKKIFTWNDSFVDNKRYFRVFSTSHKEDDNVIFSMDKKKKMCVLIARNKFSDHPNELYSERIEAIRWFETNHPDDFDLFGVGWDRCLGYGLLKPFNLLDGAMRRTGILNSLAKSSCFVYSLFNGRRVEYPSYCGPVVSVSDTLLKYKFAICYENSRFPGWITERIFNCFLAGCVPVYLGDPNIGDKIPIDTFIDKSRFDTYEKLYDYMKNMPDDEYLSYIEKIKVFMSSDRSKQFSAEYFARTIAREVLN